MFKKMIMCLIGLFLMGGCASNPISPVEDEQVMFDSIDEEIYFRATLQIMGEVIYVDDGDSVYLAFGVIFSDWWDEEVKVTRYNSISDPNPNGKFVEVEGLITKMKNRVVLSTENFTYHGELVLSESGSLDSLIMINYFIY